MSLQVLRNFVHTCRELALHTEISFHCICENRALVRFTGLAPLLHNLFSDRLHASKMLYSIHDNMTWSSI